MLPARRPFQTLLVRVFWSLLLVLVAWLLLWLLREGLRDANGKPVGPLDVLYFTVVTVTTLGYGDIVPATPEARAMVTFGITPLRIGIWLILLSTAYELVLKRSIELIELRRLHRVLKNHFVICGFGVKGRSAAAELTERGVDPKRILAIDRDPQALEAASALGIAAIRGDSTREQTLLDANIREASQAIVVPDRDEACVLICLTIQDLAPDVEIIASAREEENVRLIKNSGAKVVVAPSVSGGRLLAVAATAPRAAMLVEELYAQGHGADIDDFTVTVEEEGKLASQIERFEGHVVLAIQSGDRTIRHPAVRGHKLKEGDVVTVFSPVSMREE